MGVDEPMLSTKTKRPTGGGLFPATPKETVVFLQQAEKENTRLAFSTAEATLLATPRWLDCGLLNAIRHEQPDDFMVRVESGVTFGMLDAVLTPFNQAFSLSYPAHFKVGEVLAEDRPALETGLRGYPRDYVLKTQIATVDGQLTTSGADVVKNVTGYDLHKLYVGSQNAFGVITAATLKIMARPASKRHALIQGLDLSLAQLIIQALQAASFPLTACELFQSHLFQVETTGLEASWLLFIGLAGEVSLVEEAGVRLEALIGKDFSLHSDKALTLHWLDETAEVSQAIPENHAEMLEYIEIKDKTDALAYSDALQSWTQVSVVVETALPLAHWCSFLEALSDWKALPENWRFQVRPAAGLVFGLWPDHIAFTIETLAESLAILQMLAEQHEGFLQIRRLPWESLIGAVDDQEKQAMKMRLLTLTRQFNLPGDSAIRSLLQSLKESYDPNGLLFSPYLPLNPAVSS